MSEYRITTADELYFVTLTVVGWVDVFTRNEYKDILIKNLQYCQQNEKLEIFSYVPINRDEQPYTFSLQKVR